jgi:hypothetical protein
MNCLEEIPEKSKGDERYHKGLREGLLWIPALRHETLNQLTDSSKLLQAILYECNVLLAGLT